MLDFIKLTFNTSDILWLNANDITAMTVSVGVKGTHVWTNAEDPFIVNEPVDQIIGLIKALK